MSWRSSVLAVPLLALLVGQFSLAHADTCIELGCLDLDVLIGDCCSALPQPCWSRLPGATGAPCGDPGFVDLENLFEFGAAFEPATLAQNETEVAATLSVLSARALNAPAGANVVQSLRDLATNEIDGLAGSARVLRRDLLWNHRLFNAWDLDLRTSGLEVPTTVPAGTNVSVSLGGGIGITFGEVDVGGSITPRFRFPGAPIPSGFHAPIPHYWVEFDSSVGLPSEAVLTVTMDYSSVAFAVDADVRLFQEQAGALVDVTVSSAPSLQTVTAEVDVVSPLCLLGVGAVTGISCPPDLVLECPSDISPAITGSATATGTGGPISIEHDDHIVTAGGAAQSITRTWTATDGFSGAICEQSIEVSCGAAIPTLSQRGMLALSLLLLAWIALVGLRGSAARRGQAARHSR